MTKLLQDNGNVPMEVGYSPDSDLKIATKKYVDDNSGGIAGDMEVARYRSSAGQSADSTSNIAIQWNVEDFEDSIYTHDTTTNNSRIQVGETARYLISGVIEFNGTTDNYRLTNRVSIQLNGTSILDSHFDAGYIRAITGANYTGVTFSIILDLTANDYIEILSKRLSTVAGNGVVTNGTNLSIVQLKGEKGEKGDTGTGTEDTNAIHDNVASEISIITEKSTPVNADLIIIEDSANSNAKKRVQIGNLPGGSGGGVFESASTDSIIKEATNTNQYNRDFVVGSSQLADTGNSAHDSRMFFDKSKGAFRAGVATGAQWNDSNVGYYSHAEGYTTTASGDYSHAEGFYTTASGSHSHAEGYYATASGNYSHAEGYNTTALSNYSHAEGSETTASGNYSHAEGYNTTASDYYSHAEGYYTTALSRGSHAEGSYSNAYLDYMHSHASGQFSASGDAQYSNNVVRRATTDATQTELTLDGGVPDTASRLTLPANRTWGFVIKITARQTAGTGVGDSGIYKIEGGIKRDGSGNTALIGSITNTTIAEDQSTWSVTAEADNTNNCLVIKVTGEASKTIHWVAKVELVEVG